MAKKTETQLLEDLKNQQKSLNDKILKLEHKQLLKIGRSAKNYALVEWHETSLDNAFKFLKEQGEQQFKESKSE
tara:strand:+ start:232 stop:453 length:222 start_codon:yes stop_codon:yes gene_type:complete